MKITKGAAPRLKHVPQRTCIGCRKVRPKRDLIRLVHTSSGQVEIDPMGKEAGRGAYFCPAQSCWQIGLKGNRLDYTLRMKITPANKAQLLEFSKSLPQSTSIDLIMSERLSE